LQYFCVVIFNLTIRMSTVKELLPRLGRYARYYLQADTCYQAHSPFLYDLFEEMLDDNRVYYAFESIEWLRAALLADPGKVQRVDLGTGRSGMVSIRTLARQSASSASKGRRMFRLVQWQQPKTMLELGTSLGIGSAYLASANTRAKLVTIEGAPEIAALARKHLGKLGLKGVEVVTGNFDMVLPALLPGFPILDLVYIDGNHRKEPTLRYVEQILPHLSEEGLLVLDDIHWSAEMEAAWAAVQVHPRVRLAVDCFDIGIISCSARFREPLRMTAIPLRHKPWHVF
jgi:predicted O-methyltransferase YrrM